MTRVRQSEWRRRWGIQALQSFDGQIAASGDDGVSYIGSFQDTLDYLAPGDYNLGTWPDAWMRFVNVTIPAGATIQAATFTVVGWTTSTNDGSGTKTTIYMSDEDDPAAPTDQAEHAADPRTVASTVWDDEDIVSEAVATSPDFTAAVQEVVDRGGWASGQAMMILWDGEDTGDGAKYYQVYAYDDTPSKSPKLHVEYTT